MVEPIDITTRIKQKRKQKSCPCQLELYPEVQERLEQLWESKCIPHTISTFCHGLAVMLRQFTHHDKRYQSEEMLEFFDEILFISQIADEVSKHCTDQVLTTMLGLTLVTSEMMKGDKESENLLKIFKLDRG